MSNVETRLREAMEWHQRQAVGVDTWAILDHAPKAEFLKEVIDELTRLREENEKLREALEQIKVGADNQGPFTGMSWLQVREICDRAFDGCQADVSAVGTRSSPSRSSDTATAEERDVSLTPQGPQDNG